MDLLAELESMACNASTSITTQSITETDISRWQRLFGFATTAEAATAIENHRDDLSRNSISTTSWEILAPRVEFQGHDKESYEFFLGRQAASGIPPANAGVPTMTRGKLASGQNEYFVVKLEGPLDSPLTVQSIIGSVHIPTVEVGTGDGLEGGCVNFCKIDSTDRIKLMAWLSFNHPLFRPTIVSISKAGKDLNECGMGPCLGVESMLPQFRPSTAFEVSRPCQDEYPVWYFFYGNLADAERLVTLLGLEEVPAYVPSQVCGGKLRTWRGKYNAMLDGNACNIVRGHAYLVTSKEQEDILRYYETGVYEVVRCIIEMPEISVNGLVFRYAGDPDDIC